jgi:methanethiol S-methyltransferase
VVANVWPLTIAADTFQDAGALQDCAHPINLGFIIVVWATRVMTARHLMFAAKIAGYVFIGTALEEHDLTGVFGEEYRRYRRRVAMIVPFVGSVIAFGPGGRFSQNGG